MSTHVSSTSTGSTSSSRPDPLTIRRKDSAGMRNAAKLGLGVSFFLLTYLHFALAV